MIVLAPPGSIGPGADAAHDDTFDGRPDADDHLYDAFIAFSRADGRRAALRLKRLLEQARPPPAWRLGRPAEFSVYLDPLGETDSIEAYEARVWPALMASRFLVLAATPAAFERARSEDWMARQLADFAAGPNPRNIVIVRLGSDGADAVELGERFSGLPVVDLAGDGVGPLLKRRRGVRLRAERQRLVAMLCGVHPGGEPHAVEFEGRGRSWPWIGAASALALAGGFGLGHVTRPDPGPGQAALVASQSALETMIGGAFGNTAVGAQPGIADACAAVLQSAGQTRRPPQAATRLACSIGDALTGSDAAPAGTVSARLAAAIADAEADMASGPILDDRLVAAIRSAFVRWAAHETAGDGGRLDEAAAATSAFERGLGVRLSAAGATAAGDATIAFGRAHAVEMQRIRGRRAAGDVTGAKSLISTARDDLDRAFAALEAGAVADALPFWADLAWARNDFVIEAAVPGTASQTEARAQFDEVFAALDRAPAGSGREVLVGALAADLARGAADASERLGDADAAESYRWRCLEQASGVAPPAGKADTAQTRAEQSLGACIAALSASIDSRRDVVVRLGAEGKAREAAALLRSLIDQSTRMEGFRRNPLPWDRLYNVAALRDLAAMHDKLGEADVAESVRIEAMEAYRPFMNEASRRDLSAYHAGIVEKAWDDVWDGHYRWIDALRAAAAEKTGAEAATILEKLLAADDAWDARMPEKRVWDDVFQADVRIQLGRALADAGQDEASRVAYEEAWRRIEHYGGSFDLDGEAAGQAKAVWQWLSDWKAGKHVAE